MNISDSHVVAAATWVAGAFGTAIVYQFKLVLSLTKRIGKLEGKITEQEQDLKEYRSCALIDCPFRFRNQLITRPATVTLNTPLPQ